MAEVVGLTASVVALGGLVGNVLEGCLFLKTIAQDAKNAPRDMLTLSTHLATLETVLQNFESLVIDSSQNGYIRSVNDYIPVLDECLSIVEGLKQRIKGDVAVFKDGSGGYLDKLKAAGNKLDIGGHCRRLNDVVGRLQVAQNNLQRYR